MRLVLFAATGIALLFPAIAGATLIDMGSFTRDTVEGVDWLDLTETEGLSANVALAMFPGWEIATGGQVCGFVAQALPMGLDASFYSCSGAGTVSFSGETPPFGSLFSLWGTTITPDMTGPWGSGDQGSAGIFATGTADMWAISGPDSGTYRSFGVGFDAAIPGVGTFLVRPIPEPSTAALLALGLVGLAAGRRRSN